MIFVKDTITELDYSRTTMKFLSMLIEEMIKNDEIVMPVFYDYQIEMLEKFLNRRLDCEKS